MKTLIGTLQGNERGFGFAVTDAGDYYISAGNLNGAMDGDTVEVSVLETTDWRHPKSAYVRKVLTRANRTLVGTYRRGRRRDSVLPLNRKIPYEVLLLDRKKKRLHDNTRVVVGITDYPNAVH